ncbi:hypothetical protein A2714_02275 [Candidatus Woesebacteria bacterium RIFCSPHIGHO2_01_FULL_38_9]|uniref:PIN domain-containing protein n=2 Tax=Candidatus Woeseibacteriota TaxID=1752722 RepID=A0A1F7Y107_9BACT|nr:MAG: hypothetical protein A2714_02275 [Candidatus Woesebacteria bacterium RIFCSPHIGHO2_01_FULL_38_9]OGM60992.1 MAG: hypothetical protein A3A75_01915 [Candidatus Woesebacteria bacterium RIFCSPLOWO2_01_FULL_39_10]
MVNVPVGRWLLDTHLLVYSLDALSPFYELTRELFMALQEEKFEGVIALQNILEAENVLIKKYDQNKNDITNYIENVIDAFNFTIIAPTPNTYLTFHKLLKKSLTSVDLFDCFLAATMLDNKIGNILTLNTKDFSGIKGIQAENPFK